MQAESMLCGFNSKWVFVVILGLKILPPMPRHSTLPTLYDECKTISISSLKRIGYLKPGEWSTGTLTWSRNGTITSSIGFAANMFADRPYCELNYTSNGTSIKYEVSLVSVPSNIGKGVIWYFLCPATGLRCRKLYLIGSRFLHRKAFRGCFYEKQTYSTRNRWLCRSYETLFEVEKAYEQMYSKYFKKHYAGKPTKRYLKMNKKINAGSRIDELQIEKMMYGK